jgi:hypothetical protein
MLNSLSFFYEVQDVNLRRSDYNLPAVRPSSYPISESTERNRNYHRGVYWLAEGNVSFWLVSIEFTFCFARSLNKNLPDFTI